MIHDDQSVANYVPLLLQVLFDGRVSECIIPPLHPPQADQQQILPHE